jgi:propanol-preferring alcohol dehydrogenase
MKAIVLPGPGEPFVMEERPDPVPGPGEAVARILACGSGLTIQHTRVGRGHAANYPVVIGHEITGEIAEVGPGVSELKTGDPVTCFFYLDCGQCKWCLSNRPTLCSNLGGHVGRQIDGGYAEYMKVPARNFIKIPDGLDWRGNPAEVGVICDALATPYKVTRRTQMAPLDNVAVIGAGGGVGIHMVMMARWAHARVIAVDIVPDKLEKCREAGAHETVDASDGNMTEALLGLTGGEGVDVIVDFVSNDRTLTDGIKALGRGGRLATLGGSGSKKPFEALGREFSGKELNVMGSRYCTRQEVIDTLNIVAQGDVWPLVTEKYAFTTGDAERVHERLEKGEVLGRAALMVGG